jgi:hypothetical protein
MMLATIWSWALRFVVVSPIFILLQAEQAPAKAVKQTARCKVATFYAQAQRGVLLEQRENMIDWCEIVAQSFDPAPHVWR